MNTKLEDTKKKKLTALLLALCVAISLCACGSSDDSAVESAQPESEETAQTSEVTEDYATKENPANPREKVTISGGLGRYSFQLLQSYVGEAATDKLAKMGEVSEQYTLVNEERDQFLLLEYIVTAESGFEEEPFYASNILGNDLWDTAYESNYEYCVFDIYENAGKNYSNVALNPGESSEMYILYEIPADVIEIVECISEWDRDYWFLYAVS